MAYCVQSSISSYKCIVPFQKAPAFTVLAQYLTLLRNASVMAASREMKVVVRPYQLVLVALRESFLHTTVSILGQP
jgi:hypothetical protein